MAQKAHIKWLIMTDNGQRNSGNKNLKKKHNLLTIHVSWLGIIQGA